MILCCGEALIDMIPVPGGAECYAPHVGGSVLNTATSLGRLGVPVGLLSGLSSDRFGAMIAATLRDSGVGYADSVPSGRPTTLAFVHLDGDEASYSFYDENSATRMIVPTDLPDLPDACEALFFGGISLCNPPVADTLAGLAELHAGKATIMLDPNIRPGFASDEAAYLARLNRLIGLADIVKVSDQDSQWLLPDLADPQARAAYFLSLGPALVLRTRGRHGASVLTVDGRCIEVPAPDVTMVDTVGAGDAFNAGFLARLESLGQLDKHALRRLSDAALRDALAFAVRVAAVTVTRSGANPPWARELQDAKGRAE